MRRVALIVLAWNKWPLTERCLDSLLGTDLHQAKIIVVDNGSTDATPSALVAYADRVHIVTLPENLGFVRGMNAGIAAAHADNDVVLLNNDLAFTQRDWIGRLRDAAYAAPEHGVVGCRLLGPEIEGRVYHSGAFIEPDRLWGQQTESGLIERDVAQYTRLRRVESIAFALAYIRRDALDRIGPLDTAFHSYFEDTDYCLRAADFGIATVVAGAVTLRHDQHGSTTEHSEFRTRLFEQSRATFAARWRGRLAERYRGTVLWQGMTRSSPVFARLARDYVRRFDARGLRAAFEPTTDELSEPEDFRLALAAERQWPALPDAALVVAPAPSFAHAHGRFRVGLGISEWERVPESWASAANTLDRLIVPDAFQAAAFRDAGVATPIAIVPLGVDRDYFHTRVPAPRHPQNHFVFLAIADDLARDAPDVLIEAFRSTFAEDDPVELLMQLRPHHDDVLSDRLSALVDRARGARVRLLQGWGFPDHERAQLLAAADAYICVRRGGGWDPHAADAVALGRILIGGDFGSQAELAREHGHLVARAALVNDARHPGCRWAEPDRASLAATLRDVFDRRDEYGASAHAHAASFAAAHDIDASADRLLDEIAGGGTFAPRPAPVRAHRPADRAQPASGQIVVLGMHRSGTSSVAGVLARMGAWPGDDSELLSGPDNPRGHYELAELHSACLRRLAAAGGDWRHPPSRAPAQAIDAFRREAGAVLDTLDGRRPWLIKEPRLCLLVRELLPLLTRPVFVHVVRDPLDVADSLAARDGIARGEALALWERYTRAAFAATRGWPRVLVDYAELIADPYSVTTRLHADLVALGIDGLVEPDPLVVSSWIEPDLRRRRADDRSHAALSDAQRDLLAAIESRDILERDFPDEAAAVFERASAEAASAGA